METDENQNDQESSRPSGTTGALEQFLVLAKVAIGAAAVELVKQVLEHPSIYVFGELLHLKNIKDLNGNPDHLNWFKLLNIFAYGKYIDYEKEKDNLPELSPPMLAKLRHLTIVSLASKTKRIPYPMLLTELGMKNLRELEDLIIEVIYANVVTGKMDQQNGWLEVEQTSSRDMKEDDLDTIANVLSSWTANCDSVLSAIEQNIIHANGLKSEHVKHKQYLEEQITTIKKNMKSSGQDMDDSMDPVNSGTPPPQEKMKKMGRGPRYLTGSKANSATSSFNKLWSK